MLTNTLMISLGTAILSFLLVFMMRRNILKQPEGGKRIIDSVKTVSDEVKKSVNKQNTVLFPMVLAVFVLVLYLLNWQTSLAFLAGALATILINLILPHIVAQNSGRVVEASRKNIAEGANIALKSGAVSASLVLGLSLLITAGFYAIFQNTQMLVGLGFGVALVAFYIKLTTCSCCHPRENGDPETICMDSRRSLSRTLMRDGNDKDKGGKELKTDPSSTIALFELTTLVTIVAMVLVKSTFGYPTNPTLFVLIIASASIITFLITSFLVRFFKNTKKLTTNIYIAIATSALIFAIAVYFAKMWLIKAIGIQFLINFYGLSLIALILLFLAGIAILLNIYHQVLNNAISIADKNEISEDTKKQLFELTSFDKLVQFINKFYIIKSTALVSILLFAAYFRAIQSSFSLDLGNYLVLIGLFVGLILMSIFYWQKTKFKTESLLKNILIVVGFLIIPVVIGLTLGPVALGGYIVGVILTGLFATTFLSQSFGYIVLLTSITALLIAPSII